MVSGISLVPFILRTGTTLFRSYYFSTNEMQFSYSRFCVRSSGILTIITINSAKTSSYLYEMRCWPTLVVVQL